MIDEGIIKNSFKLARKETDSLKSEILQIKGVLEEIKAEIRGLKEAPKSEDLTSPQEEFDLVSTGNQGVLSKQINEQANKQTNEQILKSKQISKQASETRNYGALKGLESTFKSLTKQEFHVFLIIYQLEDEGLIPNYNEISQRLSLTLSCLRAHICSLAKKGAPITKTRLKNNSITLSIDKDFKAIASQQKLADFYYSIIHPHQTRLSEG